MHIVRGFHSSGFSLMFNELPNSYLPSIIILMKNTAKLKTIAVVCSSQNEDITIPKITNIKYTVVRNNSPLPKQLFCRNMKYKALPFTLTISFVKMHQAFKVSIKQNINALKL